MIRASCQIVLANHWRNTKNDEIVYINEYIVNNWNVLTKQHPSFHSYKLKNINNNN